MATPPSIRFFADADVPDSVPDFLQGLGYEVIKLRHVMLQDSKDPVVAAACRENGLVLLTHNYRDFRKLSAELQMTRKRMDSMHRIELRCSQVIARRRIEEELPLIEFQWANHDHDSDCGMRLVVNDNTVWIDRRPTGAP
jgi:predicted nuclease of predicted toxin-antitoxin system